MTPSRGRFVPAVALALAFGGLAPAQNTYTYSTSSGSSAWLSAANWTGGGAGQYPGVTTAANGENGHVGDTAVIGSYAFGGGSLGIDMGTAGGQLAVGGIDFTSTTDHLSIGNSSTTTDGTLRLNGSTINGVANTLVAVRGTKNLNLTDGLTARTMGLQLGTTNGVFQVNSGREIQILTSISEASPGSGFTVQGGGLMWLTQANTYSGTTTIADAGLIMNGGTFGSGAVVNNGYLKFVQPTTGTTVPNDIGGTGYFELNDGVNLIVTGDVTVSTTDILPGATLSVGNGGATGSLGSTTIYNSHVLNFNRSGTLTVPGTISGAGNVRKYGTGTVILEGMNRNTAEVDVDAGTLLVNGGIGLMNGVYLHGVTAKSGATFGGTGESWLPVTVDAGGHLAPGASVGTLTVRNDVTVNGTLQVELGAAAGDQLNLSGNSYSGDGLNALNLGNGSTVALIHDGFDGSTTIYTLADLNGTGSSLLQAGGADVAPGSTISIFTSTGGDAGTVTNVQGNVNITLSGFSLTSGDTMTLRRTTGGDLVMVFSPVPEPGTVLGVCALAAGGVAAWRRWRKK